MTLNNKFMTHIGGCFRSAWSWFKRNIDPI